jgi:hypothetical protein
VVDRSDRRSIVAGWLFLGLALLWFVTVECSGERQPFSQVRPLSLCALGVVAFAALADALSWVSAARAERRVSLGLPPARSTDFGLGDERKLALSAATTPYRDYDRTEVATSGSPARAARALRRNIVSLFAGGAIALALSMCSVDYGSQQRDCHWCTVATRISCFNPPHPYLSRTVYRASRCGKADGLKSEHVELDTTSYSRMDFWGNPYEFHCDGDNPYARSAGPDGKLGTADDEIVLP